MAVDEPLGESMNGGDAEGAARRPFWAVGLALLGLVGVLIGGAFLLDRQFRPPVGTQPVADTRAPVMTPPAVVAVAPTTEPTATPTSTAEPTATSTSMPTPPQPTQVPAAAARESLEREVQQAYLKYWDVLIRAYFDLDTSGLSEVMGDPELTRTIQQIEELKAAGRAAKLDIEHNALVVRLSPERATVYDEYVNNSVFVNAETKEILPTKEPPGVEKTSFHLQRFEDAWRVIDVLQQE